MYCGAADSQSVSNSSKTLFSHLWDKNNISYSYFTRSLRRGGNWKNCEASCINRMKCSSLRHCFPWEPKSIVGHRGISLTSLLLLSQNVWHLNLADLRFESLFYTLTEHCKSGLTLTKCARLLSVHQSSEWVAPRSGENCLCLLM